MPHERGVHIVSNCMNGSFCSSGDQFIHHKCKFLMASNFNIDIILVIFIIKVMNSLVTGSAKDHLFETSKIHSYYKKCMSIKSDNQRPSIPTNLFYGVFFKL